MSYTKEPGLSPKQQLAEMRRNRIVELRAKGLEYNTIAERLGVTKGCVSRVLHDEKDRREREAWKLDSP